MTSLRRAIVSGLAVAILGVAIGGGGLVASHLLKPQPASAAGDSCSKACEQEFGQCYRDTADRPACTKKLKQCLATCLGG